IVPMAPSHTKTLCWSSSKNREARLCICLSYRIFQDTHNCLLELLSAAERDERFPQNSFQRSSGNADSLAGSRFHSCSTARQVQNRPRWQRATRLAAKSKSSMGSLGGS